MTPAEFGERLGAGLEALAKEHGIGYEVRPREGNLVVRVTGARGMFRATVTMRELHGNEEEVFSRLLRRAVACCHPGAEEFDG